MADFKAAGFEVDLEFLDEALIALQGKNFMVSPLSLLFSLHSLLQCKWYSSFIVLLVFEFFILKAL